ncbi:MAG: CBS domain-containing protein [Flavobacteriales bacterium]|nr:CBS domain-containing protein [Flavobacteriales bacterium]
MIARNLISNKHPAVSPRNTVGEVLDLMNSNEVNVLPLVSDGSFIGFVDRGGLAQLDPEGALHGDLIDDPGVRVQEEEDYLTLLHRFVESGVKEIAVMNGETYHGTSTAEACALALAGTLTASQKGGVMLLTVSPGDFNVSEIARIAESEGALITGLWIESQNSSGQYVVFLKLDTPYISTIADVLSYEGYTILFRSVREPDEMITERYNSLMKYLDL